MEPTQNTPAVMAPKADLLSRTLPELTRGSKALINNQTRASKARDFAEVLFSEIDLAGGKIDAAMDARLDAFVVHCNKARKEMNADRSPFTQMMASVVKEFTAPENELDPAQAGSIAHRAIHYRNRFATQQAEEERKRQEEERTRQRKTTEESDLRAAIETGLRNLVGDIIFQDKKRAADAFKSATLDVFPELQKQISEVPFLLPERLHEFSAVKISAGALYHTAAEVMSWAGEIRDNLAGELLAEYHAEIRKFFEILVAQLPGRYAELETEAAAIGEAEDPAEAARIAEENRIEAIRVENERLEAEAAERERQNAAAAQLKAEEKKVDDLLASAAAQPMAVSTGTRKAKQSFELEILTIAGVPLVLAFWFEHEGRTLSVEEAQRKTVAQMIKFASDVANQPGGAKLDSPHVRYNLVTKAQTSRAKKS